MFNATKKSSILLGMKMINAAMTLINLRIEQACAQRDWVREDKLNTRFLMITAIGCKQSFSFSIMNKDTIPTVDGILAHDSYRY